MKKVFKIFVLVFFLSLATGCLEREKFEDVSITTTVYPIEYIVDRLYGDHSTISSIYPNDVDVNEYKLTDKQKQDYSQTDLFIFNGLSSDRDYVSEFFRYNKNLKIIDTTNNMEVNYRDEELWLDPSNFLMLAENIRYGLKQYITNHYLKTEIDNNFAVLEEEIVQMDAKIYEISESAPNKIIVSSNDLFKFLEKYGLEVISLENTNEKTISDVINLINDDKIDYIFMMQGEKKSDNLQKILDETEVEVAYFHGITNLTDKERSSKKDYLTIMSDNIDLLKAELKN